VASKAERSSSEFPKTRLSALVALGSEDPAVRRIGCETLVESYWKPIYKHLRIKWRRSPAEAEDLTQAFFAAVFEKRFFQNYDPAKARFRTYIRGSLDHFVQDEKKAASRLKRGGDASFVAIEVSSAESELELASDTDPEALFDLEWKRSLFASATEALRADCEARGKGRHFRVFEAYYLSGEEPPSYAQIAESLGIAVTDVTNSLSYARRQFRRFVIEKLRALCATDEELRLEAEMLGLPEL